VNVMAKISFLKDAKVDSPRPIAENRRFAEAQAKLAKFQGELSALREAVDRENASWYARQSSSIDEDAIGRADRMLDGQNLADDRSTQTKLAALEEKIRIIRPAIGLSAGAGRLVQDRHCKALLGILQAARHLAEAAAAERSIRRQLLDDGYEALDAFTPAPRFGIPLAMGDENICDSALWHYKKQLRELGIEP
jgi:hypothetical protein